MYFKDVLNFWKFETSFGEFTDTDMTGDLVGRKSTLGFLFTFATITVLWQSRLQKCVALSTSDTEYIAVTEAVREMLWIKQFLQNLGLKQNRYVVNNSPCALDLSKNVTYYSRMKPIDVRYHQLQQVVAG